MCYLIIAANLESIVFYYLFIKLASVSLLPLNSLSWLFCCINFTLCFFDCLIQIQLFSFFLVPRHHLSFEAQLVAGKSHDFGPLSCPELPNPPSTISGIACGKQRHDAELKYPQRIRRLNIFPANKTEVFYFFN